MFLGVIMSKKFLKNSFVHNYNMNKIKKISAMLGITVAVTGLSACGNKDELPAYRPLTTMAQTQKETEAPELPRTEFVRLEVVNKDEGIQVRILDKEGDKITGMPFTVCMVPSSGTMILDKEQSATVAGLEFSSDNKEGYLNIEELESGSYEIYLRPMPGYLDASPIPLSFIIYTYDENIMKKVKQIDEVDVSKEDRSYLRRNKKNEELNYNPKKENAVKVNNMISSGFILGTSEKFDVNVPDYNEDGDITYAKLNAKPVDSQQITLSDYVKDSNKEEIIIGDKKYTGYVYEQSKFDPRMDDMYISSAIIKDEETDTYMLYNLIPHMKTSKEDIYVGWYSKKGKHYYNNEDGYPVTGWRRIEGMWYYFDENGQKASVTGVDVSQYQEDIDWQAMKDSGIDFAIIRCGFRGYETGVLVEDEKFQQNIQAAKEVGMPFGVYIFSQAITAVEAAEEASMIVQLSRAYSPEIPLAIDIEACGGRQDELTAEERTRIINIYANVVTSQGMEPMLYSNKSWLNHEINMDEITCKVWYAMWPGEKENVSGAPNEDALEPDPDMIPDRDCEIWQYSDHGVVEGIEPLVDLNAWVPSITREVQ